MTRSEFERSWVAFEERGRGQDAHRALSTILEADHQVVADPHRLEAFLVDVFPASPEQREPLLLLARCGTPARLANDPDDQSRIQLETHRLSLVLGLPKEWLAPVVACWGRALGGGQAIPPQRLGEVSSQVLLPIGGGMAEALRHRCGVHGVQDGSICWSTVPMDDLEAILQDLLPTQTGVRERLLLLHRWGTIQRLSESRHSVLVRFHLESSRLQQMLKFPKQWLEAGINDALIILNLPRVMESVADDPPSAPTSLPMVSSQGMPYVASMASDRFHVNTCHNRNRISEARKVSYDSIAAAEADGKHPASCCADEIESARGEAPNEALGSRDARDFATGIARRDAPRPPTSTLAVVAFAMALVLCCFPVQMLGAILGYVALRRIRASEGTLGGAKFAALAILVGSSFAIIGLILLI